jgi:hypothetical protein
MAARGRRHRDVGRDKEQSRPAGGAADAPSVGETLPPAQWGACGARESAPPTKHCDIFEVSTPELDDVVRLEDRYGRTGTSAP